MKIGVMTFWNGNSNYGQILQCWALQRYLKENGHEPYVIRFIPSNYIPPLKAFLKKALFIENIKILREFLFDRPAYNTRIRNKEKDKIRDFATFRRDNLQMSERVYRNLTEIQKNPPIAEAYVVGSDQVWAQMLSSRNSRAFYLDFGSSQIKRIAYAPSFVVKEYPKEYQEELKVLLNRFDAVSCREYSGVDICKLLGIEATKVVDPTLLLDKTQYLELIDEPVVKKEQIFIYSLNISSVEQIRWNELKAFASKDNLAVKVTPSQGYFAADELFGDEVEYLYATPKEWLKAIAESRLVVTPSFHGIVLSIILGTPFVYVPLAGQYASGNSRITDLLKDLGLEDRILGSNIDYATIANQSIDWDNVYSKLANMRHSSMKYIHNSLCSC